MTACTFGGERGEQGVRVGRRVVAAGQHQADVVVPEAVRADPVARTGRPSFRHSDQVQVGQQVVEVRVHECA
jgi:hypothetical protein